MEVKTIDIPLTGGHVATVDAEDFEKVAAWKWQAKKSRNTYYACRSGWSNGKKTFVLMHHVVLGVVSSIQIDHRDGNGLNNSKVNLRPATGRQNCHNRRPLQACSSKFKGVDFYKRSGRWRARIKVNGKLKHLGEFSDEADAARAYDVAAKQLFGEFARPNFAD